MAPSIGLLIVLVMATRVFTICEYLNRAARRLADRAAEHIVDKSMPAEEQQRRKGR
jgi:hypothetical protein